VSVEQTAGDYASHTMKAAQVSLALGGHAIPKAVSKAGKMTSCSDVCWIVR
jgi:hypothetical protein